MNLSRYLDAAVLKPEMTRDDARVAIQTCVDHTARTACVRPWDIALAKDLCAGSETDVCVVLAFPHGATLSASKADEAARYIDLGVAEIDMVVNFGLVRSGDWGGVAEDIEAVSSVTRDAGVPLKVIFETFFLQEAEIIRATEVSITAGADWVKTSTGFAGGGATVEAISAMLMAADGRIQVKASGGIRTAEQAQAYIDMGVTRLGVGYSSCAALCNGESTSEVY
ncbi:MAG: deoxyribose-phosphate aldolase [Opitutales bacterium]|nr:deoxyribose-phosphate aldolase [Opitutales bacterium]NRA25794.1 deoxyribose-phosphate aldolase [Opitutales bacterium]